MAVDPRIKRAGVSGYNKPKRLVNDSSGKSHVVLAKVGEKVAEKKQEGQEAMDALNVKTTADLPAASRGDGYAKQGAYEKPEGPNMFEHRKNYGPSIKSKYANVKHGASQPDPANLKDDNDDKLLSANPGNTVMNPNAASLNPTAPMLAASNTAAPISPPASPPIANIPDKKLCTPVVNVALDSLFILTILDINIRLSCITVSIDEVLK